MWSLEIIVGQNDCIVVVRPQVRECERASFVSCDNEKNYGVRVHDQRFDDRCDCDCGCVLEYKHLRGTRTRQQEKNYALVLIRCEEIGAEISCSDFYAIPPVPSSRVKFGEINNLGRPWALDVDGVEGMALYVFAHDYIHQKL